jgi:hypothetical protein
MLQDYAPSSMPSASWSEGGLVYPDISQPPPLQVPGSSGNNIIIRKLMSYVCILSRYCFSLILTLFYTGNHDTSTSSLGTPQLAVNEKSEEEKKEGELNLL